MSNLEIDSRELTELMQQLVNQFHFLESESIPPDSEFNFRELRVILLLGYKGPSKMSDIADKLGIAVSTATGIFDRLVDKGLAARERSEEDRRIVRVDLTERGRAIYQWDNDEHAKFVKQILSRLGRTDRVLFLGLMKKIMVNADEVSSKIEK
ncbi:MarR family transcriptional regulator [bacterium]|nr:MarR family transcriptional regulator [bacterium]MBU1652064.1 MarR family transcriptional regulator [bacterium]